MPKPLNYTKFFSVYTSTMLPDGFRPDDEMRLDCPLVDCPNPDEHFYGNIHTGEWHCKRCDQGGNARTLLTMIHEQYFGETTDKQYKYLERIRHIDASVLKASSLAYDDRHDRWLVPFFTFDPERGKYSKYLNNLGYFFPSHPDPARRFVIHKAPAMPLYLYNPGIIENPAEYDEADLCEGEWDTWAWYMVNTSSLILGKPGAGFSNLYLKAIPFVDKINFLLDNDQSGRKQTAGAIKTIQGYRPNMGIREIDWSVIPHAKKDIRDLVTTHRKTMAKDITSALVEYQAHTPSISEVDGDEGDEEVEEKLTAGYVRDASVFKPIQRFGWYVDQVKEILHIERDTMLAMAATFAITSSITIPGEPIWAFLIGPPASGKTTFIESFGGTNQWFDNLSKISAESFVSGWRDDTGEDASYLPSLQNKTLFVKDFTTTLTGAKEAMIKVFGLLTDIYDGHVKIHYGNNLTKEFHDTYFNMVAGVTDIVHSHSAASIGERFLRIDWLGRQFDRREYSRRALMNFGQSNEHKKLMTSLSLGFVKHLRNQTIDLSIEPYLVDPIIDLAEFIATVRTKVETDRFEGMIYKPRAELGTRLSKQLAKLYAASRLVTGDSFSAFEVVRKVALDTCYGFPLDIVNFLLANPFATREEIAAGTGIHAQRAYRVLRDLVTTGVLSEKYGQLGGARRLGRKAKIFVINETLLPALRPEQFMEKHIEETNANRPTRERQQQVTSGNNLRPRRLGPPLRRNRLPS